MTKERQENEFYILVCDKAKAKRRQLMVNIFALYRCVKESTKFVCK